MLGELSRSLWLMVSDFHRTGRQPSCFYLGEQELSLLEAQCVHGELTKHIKTNRRTFMGIPIFVVDAPNHIRLI